MYVVVKNTLKKKEKKKEKGTDRYNESGLCF